MVKKSAPSPPPDEKIAALAAVQHGVVTSAQLGAAGLSPPAIAKRVARGRLHRLHRGVYAVGHAAPSPEQRWMAAVLACGEDAVLSHRSAAELWGLLDLSAGRIDVSVPTHGGRQPRQDIRVHRRASLPRASLRIREGGEPISALTRREGIPVTAPWLTIEDLRSSVEPKLYRRAVRQAELRHFALSPKTPRDRTRSDLERDFLTLCREHGLPAPEVNVPIDRWTIDFLWPAARVAVETDSWATHGSSVAFEDDHARDLVLRRHGFAVCRYTEQQIYDEPRSVAADLGQRLSRAT